MSHWYGVLFFSLHVLCERREVGVKFPKSFGRSIPPQNYFQIENKLKETKWERERIVEEMQREQALLDHARFNFEVKKQEFIKHLAQSSSYATQVMPWPYNISNTLLLG